MTKSIGRKSVCLILLLAGTCLSLSLEARNKTDRVTLINGDTVTGEIKSLNNGYLNLSTDSMGTVRIEWDDVTNLESDYFLRIRTSAGTRYFGALDTSPIPGRVLIQHAEGTEDYRLADILAIRPIDSGFSDRLDVALSAGYSDYKASSTSTTQFGIAASYEDQLSSNSLAARFVITDNSGETNTSNRVDLVRQRLWQNPRHFTYYGASWESNDELAIDSRAALALGVGRRVIDSSKTRLLVALGLQGVTEEDSLGESTESIEGLAVIDFDTWRFRAPELNLEATLRLYPGITESGRYRADGDITLSWEIIDDLNLNLSAFGNFDSDSNRDGDSYDYGITTGLEWEL
jgi:hypothetical protein